MKLTTNGIFVGIEIDETPCGMVLIKVGEKNYAQFQNAKLADVDVPKVIKWVEETANDGAYLSDTYISPDLHLSEFAKYDVDFEIEPEFDEFAADSIFAIIADIY